MTTIAQGIAINRLRKLSRDRAKQLADFNHFAKDHRQPMTGIYNGGNIWADLALEKLTAIDAEIKTISPPMSRR